MKHGTITMGALLAAVSLAPAQDTKPVRFEVRPFAGMYKPMGEQSVDFKRASTFGLQVGLELSKYAHVLTSVGLTDGRSKIGALISDETRMWQYDIGGELNGLREFGDRFLLRPFLGAGVGARRYDYKDAGAPTQTCGAGYASLGSELQRSVIAIRLEARGYISCFKHPFMNDTKYRSDLSFMFGFAYHVT